ncbi:MAG: hypothetical protein DDT32_01853 [Syntrophomonadaceae bacterium]|nr:hypothetical protein [Bacillota bacterium]
MLTMLEEQKKYQNLVKQITDIWHTKKKPLAVHMYRGLVFVKPTLKGSCPAVRNLR